MKVYFFSYSIASIYWRFGRSRFDDPFQPSVETYRDDRTRTDILMCKKFIIRHPAWSFDQLRKTSWSFPSAQAAAWVILDHIGEYIEKDMDHLEKARYLAIRGDFPSQTFMKKTAPGNNPPSWDHMTMLIQWMKERFGEHYNLFQDGQSPDLEKRPTILPGKTRVITGAERRLT